MRPVLLLFLLILLGAQPILAQDITYAIIWDAEDNEAISNSLVELTFLGGSSPQTAKVMSDSEGRFGIEHDLAGLTLIIKADDLSTPGQDYYGEFEPSSDDELNIMLFKVGSLHGIVLDKYDNVVPEAEITVTCDKSTGGTAPEKTDRYGAFLYSAAPVGNCIVYSSYRGTVGYTEIEVRHGQNTEASIRLEKSIIDYSEEPDYTLMLSVAGLVFAGLVLVIWMQLPKKRKSNDVFKILSHKEQNVVKFLEEHSEASQNEISREVGIPKTSLMRVVESLEKKNIVVCDNIGKYKKLKLSEWYISKIR